MSNMTTPPMIPPTGGPGGDVVTGGDVTGEDATGVDVTGGTASMMSTTVILLSTKGCGLACRDIHSY